MRLWSSLASALLALLLLVSAASGQDEPLQPTVLIIDSSASMSTRVHGNVTRLDAAREVLLDQMQGWRSDTRLAIIAYGHRRAGDCNDIETVVPFGQIDVPGARKRLEDLRARGKTPLGSAITAGSKLLPPEGGAIVLVSDGVETCEADPCAIAHDLHASNPNVVVHVVSFGVTDEERHALDCIASSGGGRLIPASSSDDLTEALHLIGRMAGISPTIPPAGSIEQKPETRLGLTLMASAGVPLYQIMSQGDVAWTVEPVGKSGPMRISDLRSPSFALGPGHYHVAVRYGDWTASRDVTVEPGKLNEYEVDLKLGRLVLEAATSPDAPPIEDGSTLSWELATGEEGAPMQSVVSIARPTLMAQEGDYVARLRENGGPVHTAPASVVAGQSVTVRIVVPPSG